MIILKMVIDWFNTGLETLTHAWKTRTYIVQTLECDGGQEFYCQKTVKYNFMSILHLQWHLQHVILWVLAVG